MMGEGVGLSSLPFDFIEKKMTARVTAGRTELNDTRCLSCSESRATKYVNPESEV